MRIAALSAASLALAVSVSAPGVAAEPNVLGTYDAWSANLLVEGKAKTCYAHSVPLKSEGNYTRRDDTYLQVSHRTADGARNEVSVIAGYTFMKGSAVSAVIDGKSFSLFTRGDGAWARDAKTDAALAAAMRAGAQLIVHGISSRGTKTTDTYSLKGFTAAYNAIGKACGVR